MFEARTQENKSFRMFCMKEPDYVIKIMASWITLDELEGAKTKRALIESSGMKETKEFIYWKPFGLHFRYKHQLNDHKNWRHAPIYLDRTWTASFWPDHNFAWYLAVL